MFEYDHSLLSQVELHKKGIRSTRELEEVIEGYSFAEETYSNRLGYKVIRFIGFTNQTKALKVACRINEEGVFITLDARIPKVEEVVEEFCKNFSKG